jgi:hypothetical protein
MSLTEKNMQDVSPDIRGAISGFVVLLCKGMIEDTRWNWDLDQFDWKQYQEGFCDPTIMKTTLAVFLNTLKLDDDGNVLNYHDAKFRAFQYFRALIDPGYPYESVAPPFQSFEIEEPDWRIWERSS